MAVFDLHVHTVKGSSDSSLTPEQLIEEARRIGLDGVCLTEHSGGWEDLELGKVFGGSGLTVIRGLEVETDMGHVLVFGLHSYVAGMHRANQLRKSVNRAGGVMVSAHPFRNLFNRPPLNANLLYKDLGTRTMTVAEAACHPVFEIVDEVEVANGANTGRENLFTLEVAGRLGFGGTGGSDVHSSQGLGRCVTVFEGDIRSESDLIDAIRARAFSPGQGANSGQVQPFVLQSS